MTTFIETGRGREQVPQDRTLQMCSDAIAMLSDDGDMCQWTDAHTLALKDAVAALRSATNGPAAAPAAPAAQGPVAFDLYARIMNLSADGATLDWANTREAYLYGHRDARHAAAEIVASALPLPRDEREAFEVGAQWQPIETAPASGYMLVHEDGAIRALLRHPDGRWEALGYPALVNIVPPGMEHAEYAIVGEEAARLLKPHGLRLAMRDGCCENPTHWMPLPPPPPEPEQGR